VSPRQLEQKRPTNHEHRHHHQVPRCVLVARLGFESDNREQSPDPSPPRNWERTSCNWWRGEPAARRTPVHVELLNRLHAVLQGANIKLSSVATNILGVSGRDIIEALQRGDEDPMELAELARGRLRAKIPQLRMALDGLVRDHHRFLLKVLLDQLDQLTTTIDQLSQRLGQRGGRMPQLRGRRPCSSRCSQVR